MFRIRQGVLVRTTRLVNRLSGHAGQA